MCLNSGNGDLKVNFHFSVTQPFTEQTFVERIPINKCEHFYITVSLGLVQKVKKRPPRQ
jgi:hypothetical protein